MNELMYDSLARKVAEYIVETKHTSINIIQQEFNLGFNRAHAIIKFLEFLQVISKTDGIKPRKVMIGKEELDWIFRLEIFQ